MDSAVNPSAIDTRLSEIWERQQKINNAIIQMKEGLAYIEKNGRTQLAWEAKEYPERIEAHRKEMDALDVEATPLDALYRKHGWSRFFLVTNGNGHVHSSRHCSTTYPRTRWAWLPAFSGKSEAEAVAEYGERMCTVCFPTAPVLAKAMGPGRLDREAAAAKAERAAKKAERAAKKEKKAIRNPDGSTLKGTMWAIRTLAEAKRELVDYAGAVLFMREGSYNWHRKAEIEAARDRTVVAIAHKTGADAAAVRVEAEAKAKKRGY